MSECKIGLRQRVGLGRIVAEPRDDLVLQCQCRNELAGGSQLIDARFEIVEVAGCEERADRA